MKTPDSYLRTWFMQLLLLTFLTLSSFLCFSQVDPLDSVPVDPGAIYVTKIQDIRFGAFSNAGSGGTVSISPTGTRSVTGGLYAINAGQQYCEAIFDVDAPIGSIVSIFNGSDISLTGSHGGSLQMHIGSSWPVSPFTVIVSQPARTHVGIGGVLTVGNAAANPPGNYNGTFYVTFNLE